MECNRTFQNYLCHPFMDDAITAQHIRLCHYDIICSDSVSHTCTITHICYLVVYKPVLTAVCITSFLPSLSPPSKKNLKRLDSQWVSHYLGLSCALAVPHLFCHWFCLCLHPSLHPHLPLLSCCPAFWPNPWKTLWLFACHWMPQAQCPSFHQVLPTASWATVSTPLL